MRYEDTDNQISDFASIIEIKGKEHQRLRFNDKRSYWREFTVMSGVFSLNGPLPEGSPLNPRAAPLLDKGGRAPWPMGPRPSWLGLGFWVGGDQPASPHPNPGRPASPLGRRPCGALEEG
jgi:hypothetical protein